MSKLFPCTMTNVTYTVHTAVLVSLAVQYSGVQNGGQSMDKTNTLMIFVCERAIS